MDPGQNEEARVIDDARQPAPPLLPPGTNHFYVVLMSNNFPGVTFIVPVDGSLTPVTSWTATSSLRSSATVEFLVGAPQATLLNPLLTSGGFQFGVVTLAGHTHTIQARTNVASGSWLDLSNFSGDGTLKQFTFPATSPPTRFFRVRTD